MYYSDFAKQEAAAKKNKLSLLQSKNENYYREE